jgi:hypothetical protein
VDIVTVDYDVCFAPDSGRLRSHNAQAPHIRKLAMLPRCITLGWRVRLAKMSTGRHR